MSSWSFFEAQQHFVLVTQGLVRFREEAVASDGEARNRALRSHMAMARAQRREIDNLLLLLNDRSVVS